MPGRRKPAKVREIEGNRSRTPIPKEIVTKGRPEPDPGLSEEERGLWRHVYDCLPVGLLTAADEAMLERFAVAWQRFRESQQNIRERGVILKTKRGGLEYPNPFLKVQVLATAEMQKAGGELGLSPLARTRLAAETAGDKDPLELLLDGRRDGAYYVAAPPGRVKQEG